MRGHAIINGVDKYIKCAYIGVNGKAQYVLKPPGLIRTNIGINVRDGDIESFAIGVIGDYLLAAGGETVRTYDSEGDEIPLSQVTTFDKNFTKSSASSLSRQARSPVIANTKDYILIGGGTIHNSFSSSNNAYNTSLTKISCSSLYRGACVVGTTTLGTSAFYAGGDSGSEGKHNPNGECRDAYIINNDLTITATSYLGRYTSYMTHNVASVGNFAIVGYGDCYDSEYNKVADAYNTTLSKVSISNLTYDRSYACMIGMKSYAITASANLQKSEAYDTSLTKVLASPLIGQNTGGSPEIIGAYNSLFGYGVFMWEGGGICYYTDDLTIYQYIGPKIPNNIYVDSYSGKYCVSFGKYVVGHHSTNDEYTKGNVLVAYECAK